MKKLLLLALLGSCTKKDDPTPIPAVPTLEGTWKYMTETKVVTPLLTSDPDITSISAYGPIDVLLTFSTSNLGIARYTAGGQQAAPLTYSYVGGNLTINEPNYPRNYKVVRLTNRDLSISSTTSDVGYRYIVTENLTRVQ
jgi:hypothetical protein